MTREKEQERRVGQVHRVSFLFCNDELKSSAEGGRAAQLLSVQ